MKASVIFSVMRCYEMIIGRRYLFLKRATQTFSASFIFFLTLVFFYLCLFVCLSSFSLCCLSIFRSLSLPHSFLLFLHFIILLTHYLSLYLPFPLIFLPSFNTSLSFPLSLFLSLFLYAFLYVCMCLLSKTKARNKKSRKYRKNFCKTLEQLFCRC